MYLYEDININLTKFHSMLRLKLIFVLVFSQDPVYLILQPSVFYLWIICILCVSHRGLSRNEMCFSKIRLRYCLFNAVPRKKHGPIIEKIAQRMFIGMEESLHRGRGHLNLSKNFAQLVFNRQWRGFCN